MDNKLIEVAKAAINEMDAIYGAFGAPGDWGYSTKEGKALFSLYRIRVDLARAVDAAQSQQADNPTTA